MLNLGLPLEPFELPYVIHRSQLSTRAHPFVPAKKSYKTFIQEGKTYFYCTCGLSENQPFCDGKHKGTSFKPLKFTYEGEDRIAGLCGCKMNSVEKGPFCDGSHKKIDFDKIKNERPF